jgi:hypothetical protein
MNGGNPDPKRGRSEDDFYPTPDDVTVALMNRWGADHIRGRYVLEPCAGDGAMSHTLARCGALSVTSSDIAPRPMAEWRVKRIHTADVFSMTRWPPYLHACVTNPPFFLAARMIPHILGLEAGPPPFLALVLKATFWHAIRRYKLFRQHPPTAVHPLLWRPDFLKLGAPTMEVMWCVWVQGVDAPTIYEPMERPGNV